MVSSYTLTLSALIHAQRWLQPMHTRDVKALLVAEPNAPTLRPLDHAVEEIVTGADALGRKMNVTIMGVLPSQNEAGSTVEIVAGAMPDAHILHLACHGQQHPDKPLQSGFYLRDDILTVGEIMCMKLPHPVFAILSACETAKGDQKQPDQAIHLTATMLFAGFRSVVATMWHVTRCSVHDDKIHPHTLLQDDGGR